VRLGIRLVVELVREYRVRRFLRDALPGLKNSALPYTGVRMPRVTLFNRISGVHPIVAMTSS
jgi:hypothetical protein